MQPREVQARLRLITLSNLSSGRQADAYLAAVERLGYDSLTMQTKVSIKGHVVLPRAIRRKLGLRTGDSLDANAEGGRIMLTLRRSSAAKARIILDPITGLPVLSVGPHVPPLRSKEVQAILSTFPQSISST